MDPRQQFRRISGGDGKVRQIIARVQSPDGRAVDITLTREVLAGLLETLTGDLVWINGRVELS